MTAKSSRMVRYIGGVFIAAIAILIFSYEQGLSLFMLLTAGISTFGIDYVLKRKHQAFQDDFFKKYNKKVEKVFESGDTGSVFKTCLIAVTDDSLYLKKSDSIQSYRYEDIIGISSNMEKPPSNFAKNFIGIFNAATNNDVPVSNVQVLNLQLRENSKIHTVKIYTSYADDIIQYLRNRNKLSA